jgi:hypothetical protein
MHCGWMTAYPELDLGNRHETDITFGLAAMRLESARANGRVFGSLWIN